MSFCYVAKRQGMPGYFASCEDAPDSAKQTAKWVSFHIRHGSEVSRVSSEEAAKGIAEHDEYQRLNPKGKPKKSRFQQYAIERREKMADLFKQGKTLQEIGEQFAI